MLVVNCFKQEHCPARLTWKTGESTYYRISFRHVKGKTARKIYFRRAKSGFSPVKERKYKDGL